MASLGIMATTIARPTLEATLDEIVDRGIRSVQFDLACAGAHTLPTHIDDVLCDRVHRAFAAARRSPCPQRCSPSSVGTPPLRR